MELRKTIVLISHREEEQKLFERAMRVSGNHANFLALQTDSWALRLLRRSQPFWFESVFLNMDMPSEEGIQFLKEIKSMPQLRHIPVVVYSEADTAYDLNELRQNGAAHYFSKPEDVDTLVNIFHALEKKEWLPFIINSPVPTFTLQNLRQAS